MTLMNEQVKAKVLIPISKGLKEKKCEYYDIGEIVMIDKNDFDELERLGYVEKAAPAAKVTEDEPEKTEKKK